MCVWGGGGGGGGGRGNPGFFFLSMTAYLSLIEQKPLVIKNFILKESRDTYLIKLFLW